MPRLHCGGRRPQVAASGVPASPGRSRPGSIAALTTAVDGARGRHSPGRSRPGSIAATSTWTGPGSSGTPLRGDHAPAPLRRVLPGARPAAPARLSGAITPRLHCGRHFAPYRCATQPPLSGAITPRLHCGAPRPHRRRPRHPLSGAITPRLHCGHVWCLPWTPHDTSPGRSRPGSIAAAPRAGPRWPPRPLRGDHAPAPLRRVLDDALVKVIDLSGAITPRLHCGW